MTAIDALPFGRLRRMLPSVLQRLVYSFLAVAELGALCAASKNIAEGVASFFAQTRSITLDEIDVPDRKHNSDPRGYVCLGMNRAAQHCQSLSAKFFRH